MEFRRNIEKKKIDKEIVEKGLNDDDALKFRTIEMELFSNQKLETLRGVYNQVNQYGLDTRKKKYKKSMHF